MDRLSRPSSHWRVKDFSGFGIRLRTYVPKESGEVGCGAKV